MSIMHIIISAIIYYLFNSEDSFLSIKSKFVFEGVIFILFLSQVYFFLNHYKVRMSDKIFSIILISVCGASIYLYAWKAVDMLPIVVISNISISINRLWITYRHRD